ncbi:MAG: hypothetical protein H5T92_01860 [Synergistales bacterium]|nr:hypothetical protein [Synergistales bacterium]
MGVEHLDPGIYTNIFQVQLPYATVDVMTAPASRYPTLRDLRGQIQASSRKIRVYRHEDIVIGYGTDLDWFAGQGFENRKIRLYDYPKWCARIIVEGVADHLKQQGYREWSRIGRTKLYEPQPFGQAAQGRLRLFKGYDMRCIYWRRNGQPLFGLVVDICWEVQDATGKRLSTTDIAQQYNAMAEIAQLQEEYLPGNRINLEVSRLRLQKHILPFVERNGKFTLPCGVNIEATLSNVPLRVIVGV